MTVAEAAARLEVQPSLIYKLCRRGLLPHARIGVGRGTIRISEDDLAAYLARCRVGFRDEQGGAAAAVGKARRRAAPPEKLKHIR